MPSINNMQMTYIDSLPKELRNELEFYNSYPIYSIINDYMYRKLDIYVGNSDTNISEWESKWSQYIPNYLKTKVIRDRTLIHYQLIPEQVLTLSTLVDLLKACTNRTSDLSYLWSLAIEFNKKLKEYGFKEQVILDLDPLQLVCRFKLKCTENEKN